MMEKLEGRLLDAYGCSAHLLNFFGQDITEQNTVGRVLAVDKYFRGKQACKDFDISKAPPSAGTRLATCDLRCRKGRNSRGESM